MPRFGLPAITGFIIVGIICGPYTLNIVEQKDLKSLSYINMFALAYITTSAGAELIIHELRPIIRTICAAVTCISFLTFGVCTAVAVALADTPLLASLMEGKSDQCQSAIAMVIISDCLVLGTKLLVYVACICKCGHRLTLFGRAVLSSDEPCMKAVLIHITVILFSGICISNKTTGDGYHLHGAQPRDCDCHCQGVALQGQDDDNLSRYYRCLRHLRAHR